MFKYSDNHKKFRDDIDGVLKGIADFKRTFSDVADDLEDALKTQFESEGKYFFTGGWKKLKPATIRRKENSRILFDTGELEDTFINNNNEKHIRNIQDLSVSVGSKYWLAEVHHKGINVPARPIVVTPARLPKELQDKITERIEKRIEASKKEHKL